VYSRPYNVDKQSTPGSIGEAKWAIERFKDAPVQPRVTLPAERGAAPCRMIKRSLDSCVLHELIEREVSMKKRIAISAVLGGLVIFAEMAAFRVFLPGVGSSPLRTLPDQVRIHRALKAVITQPGTYICPYLPMEERSAIFPDYLNEPVFAVIYRGHTHSTVPGFASFGILHFLLAPLVAACLLSQASARILKSYARRVVFMTALGLFIAVSADLPRMLTDELPLHIAVEMAVISLITWAGAGAVLAWIIKPVQAAGSTQTL
jgi:hypothetical protein